MLYMEYNILLNTNELDTRVTYDEYYKCHSNTVYNLYQNLLILNNFSLLKYFQKFGVRINTVN